MKTSVCFAWAASLLFAAAVLAQSDKGTITGSVKDPIGGAMAGVAVTATNVSTGAVIRATTSAQGVYSIADVLAGNYDIAAARPGVAAFSMKNVAVAAGKATRFDIELKEGTQLSSLGEDSLSVAEDQRRHHPPSGPTPHTDDGHPDFTGLWWSPRVIDPGKPQFLPAAAEVSRKRIEDNRKDSPQAHCLPSALTRIGPIYEIIQSKLFLGLVSDDDSPGFRQFFIDGRSHPKDPDPQWYGHSIGHWEGDTLVVDRVNFDERVWIDQDAHPHSDKLHVVERWHRPDLGHLESEVTVEDPGILAKPYTIKRVSDLAVGEELREFVCAEDNLDVEHLVGK